MAEVPLLGRQRELEAVLHATSHAGGVVITGEPGIGRSRLLAAACEALAADGRRVVSLSARPAHASSQFRAFRDFLAEHETADLVTLLRAARGALRGAGAPSVLSIDDIDQLDAGSAALLLQLVATGDAVLIATAPSASHPPEWITTLWKDGIARRLELAPLDRQHADDFAQALLDGPANPMTLDWLWERGEGNPQALRELVQHLGQSGCLRHRLGAWEIDGQVPVPAAWLRAVAERWAALDAAGQTVVGALATAGELGVDLLDALASLEGVAAAERHGFAIVDSTALGDTARLAHVRDADAIGVLLAEPRRRALLAALADLATTTHAAGAGALRVATWRLDGGVAQPAGALDTAARLAYSQGDHQLAVRFAGAAQAAGAGSSAQVSLALGLFAQGAYDDVEDVLATYETPVEPAGDAVVALALRTRNLAWRLGRPDAASAVVEHLALRAQDPAWQGLVTVLRAVCAAAHGRLDDAARWSEEVATDMRASSIVRVHAIATALYALSMSNRPRAALQLAAAWAPLSGAPDTVEPWAHAWIARATGVALLLDGQVDRAAAIADHGGAELGPLSGRLALLQGRPVAAARLLRRAIDAGDRDPDGHGLDDVKSRLAEAHATCGDIATARAVLEDVAATGCAARSIAAACIATAEGDASAAVGSLVASTEGNRFAPADEAELWFTALRFGSHPEVAAERLHALADDGDAELVRVLASVAEGVATVDGGRLERDADGLHTAGWRTASAEALVFAARAYAASGQVAAATPANARAAALAATLEGVRTPALRTLSGPTLTSREREVATLAGAGLRNGEIAERLHVSVRTVEWHLRRAYEKLGTSDRAALRALLAAPQVP